MFSLDYLDAAIFALVGAAGSFLLSVLWRLYDIRQKHDRR